MEEQSVDPEKKAEYLKQLQEQRKLRESEVDDDGGGMGWLVWILILGGVNLCSWIFDWPFWIY